MPYCANTQVSSSTYTPFLTLVTNNEADQSQDSATTSGFATQPQELSRPEVDNIIFGLHQAGHMQRATHLILKHYGSEIRAFLAVRTRDTLITEEVFSIFSEDIWRGLPKFRFQGKVRAWLFAIARNALYRHSRSRTQWRNHHVPLEQEQVQQLATVEPESPPIMSRLAPVLADLPKEDRVLLKQRVALSMNWKDIAVEHLPNSKRSDDEAVRRESARLRKRYQLLMQRLRRTLDDTAASIAPAPTAFA